MSCYIAAKVLPGLIPVTNIFSVAWLVPIPSPNDKPCLARQSVERWAAERRSVERLAAERRSAARWAAERKTEKPSAVSHRAFEDF